VKCASALAAMTVIVLGTPAIALASTASQGPGPGQVRLACPGPPGQHAKPRPVQVKLPRNRLACRWRRGCPLVFDMAPGASTLTEVAGPVLAPPEQFRYQGQTYTIMSVNPGAGAFTVFRDGMLFVNHGPAITRAVARLACLPPPVR
jgi:hypothetical protein